MDCQEIVFERENDAGPVSVTIKVLGQNFTKFEKEELEKGFESCFKNIPLPLNMEMLIWQPTSLKHCIINTTVTIKCVTAFNVMPTPRQFMLQMVGWIFINMSSGLAQNFEEIIKSVRGNCSDEDEDGAENFEAVPEMSESMLQEILDRSKHYKKPPDFEPPKS